MSILAFLFVWANKSPNQSFSEAAADIVGTITKSFGNNEPTKIAQGEKKPDPKVIKPGSTVKRKRPPPQEFVKVNPPRKEKKISNSEGKPKIKSKFKYKVKSQIKFKVNSKTTSKVNSKFKYKINPKVTAKINSKYLLKLLLKLFLKSRVKLIVKSIL